ncbi:MAG: hypothetical protein ABIT82_03705 [Ramlibacter sp.]
MKTIHPPHHWVTVALVTAAALLTVTEASGQSGAAAVFQGRPAMAGAQAGQGAMAGPPQGGIGLQGSEGSGLTLRRPAIAEPAENMPQGRMEDPPAALNGTATLGAPPAPVSGEKKRSASDKMERAAKRTTEGARYGVSPIDTR